jgi:hypothetical protein
MKKIILAALTGILIFSVCPLSAQKKLAFNDRVQILSGPVESKLGERLKGDSIELTSLIDNRRRCDYWFATLLKTGADLFLNVVDCNDRQAGNRNLGSGIFSANDSEKALLIYFAVSDILKNPYSNVEVTNPSVSSQTLPSPESLSQSQNIQQPEADPGQHRSRYFFAPSSYNLEKGELYYNSLYFLLHDVQYGMSDNFSLGMGTTIVLLPFYITPKFTIPITPKSTIAVGDMLMIGTWGTKFTGNLLYLTYTRGNVYSNFTLGGGYLTIGGKDISNPVDAPVINFSALGRISSHIYFITENYISFNDAKRTASYTDPNTFNQYSETFYQQSFFMYNLIGFRFINKTKDIKCWQIGLSFIVGIFEDIPPQYQSSYNWYTEAPDANRIIPIPVIGYARKFSTRY